MNGKSLRKGSKINPVSTERATPISLKAFTQLAIVNIASCRELTEHNIWKSPRFYESNVPPQGDDSVDHCVNEVAAKCEEDVREHLRLQRKYEIDVALKEEERKVFLSWQSFCSTNSARMESWVGM